MRGSEQASLEDRATYLNYLFRVRSPGLINPYGEIRVYLGVILRGIDVYTKKNTWRVVKVWRGSPFGPMRSLATRPYSR